MKKEHFSLFLGLFVFLVSIFASPAPVEQDFHDQQHAFTLSITSPQIAPAEQNFEGNTVYQLFQRNIEGIKDNTPFAGFYAYSKQVIPRLLNSNLFKHILNGKVSLSVWVQCFRN